MTLNVALWRSIATFETFLGSVDTNVSILDKLRFPKSRSRNGRERATHQTSFTSTSEGGGFAVYWA